MSGFRECLYNEYPWITKKKTNKCPDTAWRNIETVENLNYLSVSPQIHTEFSNILTYEYLGLPI